MRRKDLTCQAHDQRLTVDHAARGRAFPSQHNMTNTSPLHIMHAALTSCELRDLREEVAESKVVLGERTARSMAPVLSGQRGGARAHPRQ
eukprot:2787059-Rhodomonas_salina.1